MNSHRSASFALLTIACSFSGCEKSAQEDSASLPVIPRFDARGWPVAGTIAMRCTNESCSELLITIPSDFDKVHYFEGKEFEPSNVVFQFDPGKNVLNPVTTNVWTGSTQPVISPLRPLVMAKNLGGGARGFGPMQFYRESFSASCSGNTVRAQGAAILGVDGSPDGKYASVLSAEGKPSGGLPFAKNDRAKGDHFIEIWDLNACRRIGQPYQIEKPEGVGAPSICWAPDSRTVVITDAFMNRYVWFAPVPTNSDEKKE